MKKILIILLISTFFFVAGCSKSSDTRTKSVNNGETNTSSQNDIGSNNASAEAEAPSDSALKTDNSDSKTSNAQEKSPQSFHHISLSDLNNNTISGKDIFSKNNITIVNCFATWCPPCMREIPSLVSLNTKLPEGVALIGISFDDGMTAKELQDILGPLGINYPLYFDGGNFTCFFDMQAIPDTLFIDKHGNLLFYYVGAPANPEKFFADKTQELLKQL